MMSFLKFLTILTLFKCVLGVPVSSNDLDIMKINGSLDELPLELTINRTKEYVIIYPESTSINPYRIIVRSHRASASHPILVVVRQEKEILSWQVPLLVETTKKDHLLLFKNTSRTICHNNMNKISQLSMQNIANKRLRTNFSQNFIVALSTSSRYNLNVTIQVMEEKHFFTTENMNTSLIISPSEPRYVYYKFSDEDTDTISIRVDSNDDVCLTVSVQENSCPVFDSNKDIKYEGKYQTLNRKGALTIERRDFPKGFFLVFVAKADNFDCSQENSIIPIARNIIIYHGNRSSELTFVIKKNIGRSDYVRAILITLGAILVFYIVSILMVIGFRRWGSTRDLRSSQEHIELAEDCVDETNHRSTVEITYVLERDTLNVKALARYPLKDKKRSFNYLWHILSIAIFYSIPVVQLVITYQRMANQTGNEDMCYYNFLCAHPFSVVSDFNHVFSNIGYILLGILFLLVIVHRHVTIPFTYDIGIPVHYGLFYAMGIALIIEGLLSGSYHICPSQSNYQFDTSFMYVMEVLCIVKLYQNRHPDINATAYATFTVLGVAIFLAMVGILNGNLTIWILFVVLYTMLVFYVSFKIYYLSYIFQGVKKFKDTFFEDGFTKETFIPIKRARFILLLLANIVNFTILGTGLSLYSSQVTDFGTFLLGLFMANALLYAIFYTSMKLVHKERICIEAICYGLLALGSWIAATIFFIDAATIWTVTPAESRRWNQECILMSFYDKHDVWHLLSAPALYFTFMFLLTLDDDLIEKRQDQMAVF